MYGLHFFDKMDLLLGSHFSGGIMKLGRRVFLAILAAAAAAFGIYRSRHSLKVFLREPERKSRPEIRKNPFVRGRKSLVAAAGGTDLKRMVREAVASIGGFGLLDLRNRSVLVKPNIVGGRKNPTTTNPAVIEAVVKVLYEEGAARVFVGDMSALIRGGTKKNMERTGIMKAVNDSGAEPVFFEDHGWVNVKVEGKYIKEVSVTEWIFNVDKVINVPVIKTHKYAGYSICLKNFVGATHFSQRPYLVDRTHWEEVVSELNLAYRPDLNIVDGTKVMIEGGPWEGAAEDAGIILAGGDRIACDVTGLAIVKSFGRWKRLASISPWEMRQVKRAVELGLGAKNASEMELVIARSGGNPAFNDLMEKVQTLM
jgi:uncharacterized protein (DUF362 family)